MMVNMVTPFCLMPHATVLPDVPVHVTDDKPHEANARARAHDGSVPECGRAPCQIEPSPPLKVANAVKPRNGRSSLSEPEWQVISYFRP